MFTPSTRRVATHDVETFLASLPSPALLSPTTIRGIVALTLLHELSGERRRSAEKILSNFTMIFDDCCSRLGLTTASTILLKLGDESHYVSHAGARCWTQQFGVQVGWNLRPLRNNPRAQAALWVRRNDGLWSGAE